MNTLKPWKFFKRSALYSQAYECGHDRGFRWGWFWGVIVTTAVSVGSQHFFK